MKIYASLTYCTLVIKRFSKEIFNKLIPIRHLYGHKTYFIITKYSFLISKFRVFFYFSVLVWNVISSYMYLQEVIDDYDDDKIIKIYLFTKDVLETSFCSGH